MNFSSNFGLMPEKFSFPDEISVEFDALYRTHSSIIDNLISRNAVDKNENLVCIPFYNVFKQTVDYLPDFFNLVCGSNGLCAGNSPEEALCQGICELFERFIVKKIFTDNVVLPEIPLSRVAGLENFKLIKEIIFKRGYHLIIKDCTLGGMFPVLGIIVFDKDRKKYCSAVGSDPIFEVALQRCLIELFQGISAVHMAKCPRWQDFVFSSEQYTNTHFNSTEKQLKSELLRYLKNGSGKLPDYVFFSDTKPNYTNAFQSKFKTHSDSLKFVLAKIKKYGYQIYVRDLSYLGFPTFRVYIPGMAETYKIDNKILRASAPERKFISKCMLGLKKCSNNDVHKCANLIESLLDIPIFYNARKNMLCAITRHIILDPTSDLHQFHHFAFLLTFLFYRAENYEKAFKYLALYLKDEQNTLDNPTYYKCVLVYFKLKTENASNEKIENYLKSLFGETISKEVIADLSNPDEAFKYFMLPECGNCSSCPVKDQCYYEKWKKVNYKIEKKMAEKPIKQEALSNIFQL